MAFFVVFVGSMWRRKGAKCVCEWRRGCDSVAPVGKKRPTRGMRNGPSVGVSSADDLEKPIITVLLKGRSSRKGYYTIAYLGYRIVQLQTSYRYSSKVSALQ